MKTLRLFAMAALAIIVASCSSGKPKLTHLPAQADGDSNWGLVDANGDFLYSDEFDNRPSPVVNGFFFVEEGDGYTIYKAEKKMPKQVGDLSELKDCGFFNDGVMPVVHKGEHIAFVDADGKTKFTLEKVDSLEISAAVNMFMNGRCAICNSEGRWGAIDNTGKVVIPLKYDSPIYFTEKYAIVRDAVAEKSFIIDLDGNVVAELSAHLSRFSPFIDGIAMARIESEDGVRIVFVKTDGEVIKLPASVDDVLSWNYRYAVFENNDGDCGIISIDGEVKVRAKYSDIEMLANGKFIAHKGSKFMYITPDGDTDRLDKETGGAIRYSYLYSHVFDFDFELLEEDDYDNEYHLLSYSGDNIGDDLSRIKTKIAIDVIESDYFDYDGVVNGALSLFDAKGLKGYPFGSQMAQYVDSVAHNAEWYRGDSSLGANVKASGTLFTVSSATIYSNQSIVYDATPFDKYYTWAFNRDARVNAVRVDLSFNKYRDDLAERIASALHDRYGIEITNSSYDANYVTGSYGSITIHISKWTSAPAVEVPVEVDSVAVPIDVVADSVI